MMSKDTLHFLEHVMKLKGVPRTGWINHGVKDPESVAEHSLGVAFFALALARDQELDEKKVFLMAAAHDVAESVVGDIVWETGHGKNHEIKAEKEKKEREVINKLCEVFGPDIKELVFEYMEQNTPEAQAVKEADKLEMVMQALLYEDKVPQDKLLPFWPGSAKYMKTKLAKELFKQMLARSTMSDEAKSQVEI